MIKGRCSLVPGLVLPCVTSQGRTAEGEEDNGKENHT
jgi:hypothetical protein